LNNVHPQISRSGFRSSDRSHTNKRFSDSLGAIQGNKRPADDSRNANQIRHGKALGALYEHRPVNPQFLHNWGPGTTDGTGVRGKHSERRQLSGSSPRRLRPLLWLWKQNGRTSIESHVDESGVVHTSHRLNICLVPGFAHGGLLASRRRHAMATAVPLKSPTMSPRVSLPPSFTSNT
jgi:hypothetical protein